MPGVGVTGRQNKNPETKTNSAISWCGQCGHKQRRGNKKINLWSEVTLYNKWWNQTRLMILWWDSHWAYNPIIQHITLQDLGETSRAFRHEDMNDFYTSLFIHLHSCCFRHASCKLIMVNIYNIPGAMYSSLYDSDWALKLHSVYIRVFILRIRFGFCQKKSQLCFTKEPTYCCGHRDNGTLVLVTESKPNS